LYSLKKLSKCLFLPIEIFDRELGGAILLAEEAVSRGWMVILGGKQAIFTNMSRFRDSNGIFFLKSIVPGEVFMQNKIISFGHRIVSLDVEGLVPSNGESGVRLRYSSESIEKTDLIFFWGKNHYNEVFKCYPLIEEKSFITGSPIIDEIKLKKIHNISNFRKNRKKILIGTSCGFANHINGLEFSKKMTQNAYANNIDYNQIVELEAEIDLDIFIFEYWKKIIPLISQNFPDSEIILRPHPSENYNFWKSYIKLNNLKNLRIDFGTSILNELSTADVYIHFNSTSAITSSILDIPTIMPMPPIDNVLENRITYVKNISQLARNEIELIDLISIALKKTKLLSKPLVYLYPFCENLNDSKANASKEIMNVIDSKYDFIHKKSIIRHQNIKEYLLNFLRKIKFLFLFIFSNITYFITGKINFNLPPINAYKSSKAKQPNIKLSKLKEKMQDLIKPENYKNFNIVKISNNIFLIELSKKNHEKK
jgi:surface carbohydrate biosynthesis protein